MRSGQRGAFQVYRDLRANSEGRLGLIYKSQFCKPKGYFQSERPSDSSRSLIRLLNNTANFCNPEGGDASRLSGINDLQNAIIFPERNRKHIVPAGKTGQLLSGFNIPNPRRAVVTSTGNKLAVSRER